MNYKELNLNQKRKINGMCDSSCLFEWEDRDCMKYLLGNLPDVAYMDDNIKKEINLLNKMLMEYTPFLTSEEKDSFFEAVKQSIAAIHDKNVTWRGIDLDEIKDCMNMHKFCLIMGEGGIGKSFFIKCLEEKLDELNIEHLCVYGKFMKNLDDINVDELVSASSKGFVFIVDAINEMTLDGQHRLLEVLKQLSIHPKIRIIITCRTNAIEDDTLKQYKELSKFEYKFKGVSFSSALSELLKLSVPDIYKYEDILFSNNALFLLALKKVLSSEKIAGDSKLKGITSITYILEQYIKISIDDGLDKWKCIKIIADWMYNNKKREIDYNSLTAELIDPNVFLDSMIQNGLMDFYKRDDTTYYYFTIDSLTDYLVARSLLKEVSKKSNNEKINFIRQNMKDMYWLKDAFIVGLFDQMGCEYNAIYDILKKTDLIDELDFTTLLKVHYEKDKICGFLKVFNPSDKSMLLHIMGGFTDKPFNATNYLFNYYCSSQDNLLELSRTLSGRHFNGDVKNRLKNLLYFLTINNRPDRRDDEAFYFSLLCCAAPNRDVRYLAEKLLYEVAMRNETYVDSIISEYENVLDFYIKESMVFVLAQLKKQNKSIIDFFYKIIENDESLTAKSIRRISGYLGTPNEYINWNRKNLYSPIDKAEIPDFLDKILFTVDIMNDDILPFKYYGKDKIDRFSPFCSNKKEDIRAINDHLIAKYKCVRTGECCGSPVFENKVMPEIKQIAKIDKIDYASFLVNLSKVITDVFNYYQCQLESRAIDEDSIHSTFMKCIDIAVGVYYGSIMCNYYTDTFATYNNKLGSIGYEIYDPLEQGEDKIITSPITIYQGFVERLGKSVLNLIEIPQNKDSDWHSNVCLTEMNVINILKYVTFKDIDWVMIAGRVLQSQYDGNDLIWRDEYLLHCCTNENETIINDGCARNLTIKLDAYIGDVRTYIDNVDKPWLCKKVEDFSSSSDIFEQTYLVLPPTDIIKFFNLAPNLIDLSWETENNEKVIICNNNEHSYYRDNVVGSVFMRKDYFEKFIEAQSIKFFGFTERFMHGVGYSDATSLHFEISDGRILKSFRNDDCGSKTSEPINPKCDSCEFHHDYYNDYIDPNHIFPNDIEEMLKKYGIDFEE